MTNTDTAPVANDTVKVQVDYFGQSDDHKHMLPDGVSYVMLKEMREGERRKYLNKTNRDITIARASGDARLRLAPGDERFELLTAAITDWGLTKKGKDVPFNQRNLAEFLDRVDPRVADGIEEEVRRINPWLNSELSIEDIEAEIDRLQELLEKRQEEERGKLTS